LINDRRFRDHPMLLETPKEDGPRNMDAVNLRTLRRLVQSSGTARSRAVRAVRCAPQ
jgi:hypothetical protein